MVKVHAQGFYWWLEQELPPTMTIGCRTLEQRPDWRTYAQPRYGAHFIYRAAPGLRWPTAEYDTFIDTRTYWTRMPPDDSKFWICDMEPTEIDWFPDLEPMHQLALDAKKNLNLSQ